MRAEFDAIVIGGGITGAGLYRALRRDGLATALIEAREGLGEETTANSSCLIHGGLRYLIYDPRMTAESSRDSGRIRAQFPQLLTRLPFLWPIYEGDRHGLETVESLLEAYDGFADAKGAHPHMRFDRATTLQLEPGIKKEGLLGAVCFEEWFVDPRRLTEAVAQSASGAPGVVFKGRAVTAITREGVRLADATALRARWVINAAGPWADRVAALAGADFPMRLRKGVHLVYPGRLTRCALLVPAVDGTRHIFSIPGGETTLLGPTDTPFDDKPSEASVKETDIEYLDRSMRRIFPRLPQRHIGTRLGIRPILGQRGPEALLSRDFEVIDHETRDGLPGLITVAGGKMTTYASMAEETLRLIHTQQGGSTAVFEPRRSKLFNLLSGIASVGAAYGRHQLRRLTESPLESTQEDFEKVYGRS